MKRKYLLLLILVLIFKLALAQNCPAGTIQYAFTPTTSVQVIACKQIEVSLGKQSVFWGVKNLTNDKLYVKFVKVVYTTCGKVLKSNADTYLDPRAFVGGTTFFGEITFETQVWKEDCSDTKNRIKSIAYEGLMIRNISEEERKKEQQNAKTSSTKTPPKSVNTPANTVNTQQQVQQQQQNQGQAQVNTQANQQQQYQTQANANVTAARNNPSPIGSMADLNKAEMNATAAGNTAQVQEIERMKNQQIQQQTNDLANAAGQLVNSIINIAGSGGSNKTYYPSRKEHYQNYIEESKSSNDPEKLITVAINYSLKNDYVAKEKYLEKAAQLGSIDAMNRLIFLYANGAGKTFKPNMELQNKWLIIAVNAILGRLMDEANKKPLTIYEKNAWKESTSPGDNNEVTAIADIAEALVPKPKTINPQDSINRTIALFLMTGLEQKYRNKYLNLHTINFASFLYSEYALSKFYAENVDKKSDTENMKLALSTYNAFKEIAANYVEKGAENKDYEKYYGRLTKDRTKELKDELKKRLKELNMPDQVL